MEITFYSVLILIVISFIAGLIDSIAGGGGLLMIPSYILLGIPPHSTLGTNKFAATLGTSVAVFNFMRKGKVSFTIILSGISFALFGAFIGSKVILFIDENMVGKLIAFLLPFGIFFTLMPKKGDIKSIKLKRIDLLFKIPLICLVVGFYDGLFGPGTGAFLALSFNLLLKINLIEATANAKVVNFVSNFGALIAFLMKGEVIFILGIPLAISSMVGNYFGSQLAIKNGEKFIRIFLIIVMIILVITLFAKYF